MPACVRVMMPNERDAACGMMRRAAVQRHFSVLASASRFAVFSVVL